jgi:PE-PPE domain/PE family
MSYLVTAPEALASTAADVSRIGSAIGAANASAAGPTAGLAAAAEDEVSAAIARLFSSYGLEFQALIAQAVAFHDEFAQTLSAAGNAYAQAEATAAALLGQTSTGGASTGVGALTSAVTPTSPDPVVALLMGGNTNPQPSPSYVGSVNVAYIQRFFPGAVPQSLFTPEQFWPLTPSLGNLTFGQSVAQGVPLLNTAINNQINTLHNNVVVFGYSQSAVIATDEINALLALPAAQQPTAGQLAFILAGDPNNPVGGLLERFPGFYIPLLDVPFNGATPQSPWHTTVYTLQYDGIADAPQYPLDVVSDLNAIMGFYYIHGTYPMLTTTQIADATLLPTSGGNTQYYMVMTQNLPLLQPIREIPYVGTPFADLVQPDLRVVVDLGYADYGPDGNYANVPTPAGLFSVGDPFTIVPDLAIGAVQGVKGALVDVGWLPASDTPTAYPYVPSLDPHLNFFLGQSSTTLLSTLSGDAGGVLELIPPVLN